MIAYFRNIFNRIMRIFPFYNKFKNRRIATNAIVIQSNLGQNISIGKGCYLYNVTIGDYTYLAKDVVGMNTKIGKFCSIAQGVCISLGMHPTRKFVSTSPVFFSKYKQCGVSFSKDSYFREMGSTLIGNDVWIGVNAIIMDDITIGDGAIVAAGAIVTKNVPPYSIVAGNPAKVIRYRFNNEIIDFLLKIKWWEKEEQWLKDNFKDFHDIETFKQKYMTVMSDVD
jgi:acetyltransferase-like isoleucine patch superfamily enzyme